MAKINIPNIGILYKNVDRYSLSWSDCRKNSTLSMCLCVNWVSITWRWTLTWLQQMEGRTWQNRIRILCLSVTIGMTNLIHPLKLSCKFKRLFDSIRLQNRVVFFLISLKLRNLSYCPMSATMYMEGIQRIPIGVWGVKTEWNLNILHLAMVKEYT